MWTYVCRQVCGLCVHIVARDQHRVSPSSSYFSGFRTLVPGRPGSVRGGLLLWSGSQVGPVMVGTPTSCEPPLPKQDKL